MGIDMKAIFVGWGKWTGAITTTPEERKLSKERLKVCGTCDYAKESKVLEFIAGSAENIDIIYCNYCHCPCHQKSLSGKTCELGKWDHLNELINNQTKIQ